MGKLPTSTNLLIGFGHPPPPLSPSPPPPTRFCSSRARGRPSPESGPSAEAAVVPVLFLMPWRGTEPTTIARWSLLLEEESRFCQKAAAKATRPDHRHASLPRRICTDHAQFSATTVVMVRHAAPGSKADLYFSGQPGGKSGMVGWRTNRFRSYDPLPPSKMGRARRGKYLDGHSPTKE